jgi:hypothetical protein
MPLSTRAKHALRDCLGPNSDLDRPEEVARANYDRLRSAWGCGPRTIREIRLWLREHGHDLAGVPAPSPRNGSRATWIGDGVTR